MCNTLQYMHYLARPRSQHCHTVTARPCRLQIEDHHNFLLDECSRMRDEMPGTAADMSLGQCQGHWAGLAGGAGGSGGERARPRESFGAACVAACVAAAAVPGPLLVAAATLQSAARPVPWRIMGHLKKTFFFWWYQVGARYLACRLSAVPAGATLEALWAQHLPSLGLRGPEEEVLARKLFDWHLANLEFANACERSGRCSGCCPFPALSCIGLSSPELHGIRLGSWCRERRETCPAKELGAALAGADEPPGQCPACRPAWPSAQMGPNSALLPCSLSVTAPALVGPPGAVQRWCPRSRSSFGTKTTLMSCWGRTPSCQVSTSCTELLPFLLCSGAALSEASHGPACPLTVKASGASSPSACLF